MSVMTKAVPQSGKFKQAARELECDEDEARWDERLRKVAKLEPATRAKTSRPE